MADMQEYLKQFIKFLIVILFIFLILPLNVKANNTLYWKEVNPSSYGRQFYDLNSLTNITSHKLTINSKFIETGNDNIMFYKMMIDCSTHKYKDLKINDTKVLKSIWLSSTGDELIDQVITQSCELNNS